MTTATGGTSAELNGKDLTEVLEEAKQRGFAHNFGVDGNALLCAGTNERFECEQSWVVGSTTVDMGTDPGDDATVYLIETESGRRGYVIVPASIYAEPAKAAFIDRLKAQTRSRQDSRTD